MAVEDERGRGARREREMTLIERAKTVFNDALELPEAERTAFVARECAGDAALRGEVEALLGAFKDGGGFLSSPTGHDAAPTSDHVPGSTGGGSGSVESGIAEAARRAEAREAELREKPGTRIGPYKLLQMIGEGGFGSVFLAEQEQPVQRRVALKIIKLGMDTRQVIARFEAERQALALMDHPNIAKVLDAGATETGRPYFVMELVKGQPITAFCDQCRLSIEERLELFGQVCAAVQHAHTKGIIHRDIKPSNVLVNIQDGRPFTKVIDFGIAKATQSKLTERTLFTEHHQWIGTPEYMSPEQAQGSLDIDTRTDVYSLGVLLYELLTGSTPFSGKELRSAAYDELQRIIREVEPPKPSTRLSQNTETIAGVAASRQSEPRKLGLVVRGELDWIVMKSLEKDRQRRYETPSGLAMDIRRYLSGEAVVAAPPGAAYRARKFLKRHRVVVSAGTAVAAALLVGIAGFAWQAHRAGVQRNRAIAAESEALRRADELQRVADFQAQMLEQVDPTTAGVRLTEDVRARFEAAIAKSALPDDERAAQVESFAGQWGRVNATDAARELIDRTILKPAVTAVDTQFADQPVVAAMLRNVLGQRYHGLGLYEAALALERQALAERRRVLGADHTDTLSSQGNVGIYLNRLGRLNEAEPYYREALERSRRAFGESDPRTLICIANMGGVLLDQGKLSEAEPYYREAMEKRRRLLGEDHSDTLMSVNNWAVLLQAQGKPGEAEPFLREVLGKRRRLLGNEHRDTLTVLNNLAGALRDQGRIDEAIACMREAVENRRRVLGEVHPGTLKSIQSLGTMLGDNGHPEEAESLMREALMNERRLLGADHPSTINSMSNLGVFLLEEGKPAEAEPMCREALERRRRVLGENHPETLISYNVVGYVLRRQDKDAEAEPFLRQTLAISRSTLGPEHRDTFLYAHNLALLLISQNKTPEAELLLREVTESGGRVIGAGHPIVLSAAENLGDTLLEQKRYGEALEVLSAAEPDARKTYAGRGQGNLAGFMGSLGRARALLKNFAAAEADLLESRGLYVQSSDPARGDTGKGILVLVNMYTRWDEAEPGKGYDVKAAEWKAKLSASDAPKEHKQ